jgi:hypothetical protein
MPSPGEDYQSWSPTAIDNGSADPLITWVEGQTRASVNNSSRSEMAAHAKNRNLINGSIITAGSANAQTFQSGVSYTSIPTGLVVKLKIGPSLTNTGSTTLNMDGIGDVLVQTAVGENLRGTELTAGSYSDFLYNGTNWVFLYSHEFFWNLISGGGGLIVGVQKFTVAGLWTYTPDPAMECCTIECIGGGGAGGGASSLSATVLGGGGGGSGGYSRVLKTAADIGFSQPVMVGAAGIGAANASGTDGGDTWVGATFDTALCAARGGKGGGVAHPTTDVIFTGDGGAPGIGDIAAAGTPGGPGQYGGGALYITSSADGGSSALGGGGLGSVIAGSSTPQDGNPGRNYGSGGGGGNTYHTGTAAGGNGSPGIIIITEFGGRGIAGSDGDTGPPGPMGPPGPAGAGTGDVLVSGTPAAGQFAQWVDTSHIKGASAPYSTGDAKATFRTVADAGWILLNDGSIGDATSGATTRGNIDCSDLFVLMWTNIPSLVVQDNTGAVVTRGASAVADFGAHRRLVLPKALGHALGVAGSGAGLTTRPLGTTAGSETQTLATANLASHSHTDGGHTHPFPSGSVGVAAGGDYTALVLTAPNITLFTGTGSASIGSTGSGTPINIVPPTTYLNVMVKL